MVHISCFLSSVHRSAYTVLQLERDDADRADVTVGGAGVYSTR